MTETCHTCRNSYERTFTVTMGGNSYVFDSFECAIAALAPTCALCGVRVIGHGIEVDDDGGAVYCCAHCAQRAGNPEPRDHV